VQVTPAEPPLLTDMLARGLTGRKGGGGFYRRSEGPQDQRNARSGRANSAPRCLPEPDRRLGDARAHCSPILRPADAMPGPCCRARWHAAALVPEIADRPASSMKRCVGYGWKFGPFELIDRIGADWFAKTLEESGAPVPPLLAAAAAKGGFYRGARRPQRSAGSCRWRHRLCADPDPGGVIRSLRCVWPESPSTTPPPACGTLAMALACSNSTAR
jgi:3-hydroxyacyl-CoA dehydrogenase